MLFITADDGTTHLNAAEIVQIDEAESQVVLSSGRVVLLQPGSVQRLVAALKEHGAAFVPLKAAELPQRLDCGVASVATDPPVNPPPADWCVPPGVTGSVGPAWAEIDVPLPVIASDFTFTAKDMTVGLKSDLDRVYAERKAREEAEARHKWLCAQAKAGKCSSGLAATLRELDPEAFTLHALPLPVAVSEEVQAVAKLAGKVAKAAAARDRADAIAMAEEIERRILGGTPAGTPPPDAGSCKRCGDTELVDPEFGGNRCLVCFGDGKASRPDAGSWRDREPLL